MELCEYFENTEGVGVLSTAASDGAVNAAIYARPHVLADGTIGFLMANRLTYQNITINPKAVYLFKEEGSYRGVRLYLTKLAVDEDPEHVAAMRRRIHPARTESSKLPAKWVTFRVDSQRPLTGTGSSERE